ncbi:MAG: aminotransferase class I/II-fold pyridoxal phosphate-dependent enzyme [Candidatus Dormibacteraeota bacterium]|nr:aminotransferase class I/II-fold pyridoxal phosphate-dependent enzyme [Candidatus Dormibacteraeota bacterium]
MQVSTAQTVERRFDDISLAELRHRHSYKWRAYPEDVLPAFVAEMDFRPAPVIVRALTAAAELGDTGYACPQPELGEAYSHFALRRFGWRVEPTDVTLSPDVMSGITELLRLALKPGAGVVINPPVYPPFFRQVAEAGCRVIESPLLLDEAGYHLDLNGLEAAFRGGARALLLCSPHNPTGIIYPARELEQVAELAERYGALVFSDEIHAPLVLPGREFTPYLAASPVAAAHGIAFVAASKGWNLPGLKCAQIVSQSTEMRALIQRLPPSFGVHAGLFGILAAVAAYEAGDAWLDQVLETVQRNADFLAEAVRNRFPQVAFTPPSATYLAWLDCRELNLPEEPVDHFLKQGRVALGGGPPYGSTGCGYLRVNIGTTAAILEQVIERMETALR